jgi:hypothetical protein
MNFVGMNRYVRMSLGYDWYHGYRGYLWTDELKDIIHVSKTRTRAVTSTRLAPDRHHCTSLEFADCLPLSSIFNEDSG